MSETSSQLNRKQIRTSHIKRANRACIMGINILASALLFVFAACCTSAPRDERALRAKDRLQELLRTHQWPGATLAWIRSGDGVVTIAAGMTDSPDGRAIRPRDRIFSGSIGKTYVAAVMLQLVSEGRANLDDPISRFLGAEPWFARIPNASSVTLQMLLTHTSGIPEHIQNASFQEAVARDPFRVWKGAELMTYVCDEKPLFAAGSGFSYADTNYILIGMIIEQITGRTYYQELTERVLKPLNLRDTTPADRPDLKGLICGHTTTNNPFRLPLRTLVNGRYPMNPQVEWTGGGLITTSADLARWAVALYNGDVLTAKARELMLQTGPTDMGLGVRYGLGVITWEGKHGPVWGHTGWVPGYVSGMAWFPKLQLAVAVQINSDVKRSGAITRAFLDEIATAVM